MTAFDTRLVVEVRHPQARLPQKANPSDACYDLVSPQAATIPRGATLALDIGLGIQLEAGWEAQLRGRSGLAKCGIVVHPGTIDHLYRQNVKVLIHNLSGKEYHVAVGDRIAQMKLAPVWRVEVVEGRVEATERGGLGSTGR